jgi:Domain of unknown function (DUF4145)
MQNGNQLPLDRCPHCGIAAPTLSMSYNQQVKGRNGEQPRWWFLYHCASCAGAVMTEAQNAQNADVARMWPSSASAAEELPERARQFLNQALASVHAPAGAVMLTASAIDAMLKDKGLKQGSLSARIDQAAANHLITAEMAAWAHETRLDANDQRHADESATLPSRADAEKVIAFAQALAQFLYVLPARVERGRKS